MRGSMRGGTSRLLTLLRNISDGKLYDKLKNLIPYDTFIIVMV